MWEDFEGVIGCVAAVWGWRQLPSLVFSTLKSLKRTYENPRLITSNLRA